MPKVRERREIYDIHIGNRNRGNGTVSEGDRVVAGAAGMVGGETGWCAINAPKTVKQDDENNKRCGEDISRSASISHSTLISPKSAGV
jgi:hypothetical protein